jgi:blue light- and temperature-responsive anti-repressor
MSGAALPAFSYAFQPVVDVAAREVFSHEALVRGAQGQPARQVLQAVPTDQKYAFDQHSRVAAIALAMRLGLAGHLNLNVLPNALFTSDDAIVSTINAAQQHGLPLERVVLEVTEGEAVTDYARLAQLLNQYRSLGLKVAIDDFGAGYSGLNMLADFQPDQVKIDMNLVRGIESHGPRQAIVRAVCQVCLELGIDVIAEGVETDAEYRWFRQQGVHLFQGWLFARPAFESLPAAFFPA